MDEVVISWMAEHHSSKCLWWGLSREDDWLLTPSAKSNVKGLTVLPSHCSFSKRIDPFELPHAIKHSQLVRRIYSTIEEAFHQSTVAYTQVRNVHLRTKTKINQIVQSVLNHKWAAMWSKCSNERLKILPSSPMSIRKHSNTWRRRHPIESYFTSNVAEGNKVWNHSSPSLN